MFKYFAFLCFALFPLSCSSNTDGVISPSPTRSTELSPEDMTPLQKHVAFFDRDKDGVVYPWETFQGFRAIGASLQLSTVSALLINKALSQKTRPGKPPSPLFPIEIANIKLAIHGSDSGAYDSEGRFVPSKFEDIFVHSKNHTDALTGEELKAMLEANKEPNDKSGWLASAAEWKALFDLTKDKDGLLHKDTIRAVYDGSLFEKMEKDHASKKKNRT